MFFTIEAWNARGEYMQRDLSIIISALNEQDLIASTVAETLDSCKACLTNYELILINDGSSDGTGRIMEDLAVQYPNVTVIHHEQKKGLGVALQSGLKVSQHEHIMLLCGDGGLPGKSLPPIFNKIGQADLIVPYMSNMKCIKTPFRLFLSKTYTLILNILFWQSLKYYNGLPVYKTKHLKQLKVVSKGFAFQAEIVTKLLKSGCTYIEVETDGAEKTNRSTAVTIKGFYEIAKILLLLVWEIILFSPTKQVVKHDLPA